MKIIEIIPFNSAGELKLNETREELIPKISFKFRSSREMTQGINDFIIDDYEEVLLYYNKTNNKLFYVLFAPLPTYELLFYGHNLFSFNSGELFIFLKNLDSELYIEDYVGFGSLKYGIDIYAPNFTEDKNSLVEAISFAIQGYFDSISKSIPLNVNELQDRNK